MDGAVYVWDMKGMSMGSTLGSATANTPSVTVLRHHKEAVVGAVLNNDVSALVTSDKGGMVALWSLVG